MARDLTGQTFSRWTVVAPGGRNENRLSLQIVQCACGNVRSVRTADLEQHKTKSCGCYRDRIAKGRLNAAYGSLQVLENL